MNLIGLSVNVMNVKVLLNGSVAKWKYLMTVSFCLNCETKITANGISTQMLFNVVELNAIQNNWKGTTWQMELPFKCQRLCHFYKQHFPLLYSA